jgi:DNA modification methylase
LGSGTTLIAAQSIGRVCYGIEIDPIFVDVAIRRWQAFSGERATRLRDGLSFNEVARQATERVKLIPETGLDHTEVTK